MNGYTVKNQVRFNAVFRDVAGELIDPSTVKFIVRLPNNQRITYTYGTNAQLIRDGAGSYHVDVVLNISGTWTYRFEGSGNIITACEDSVNVLFSPIYA